MCTCLHESGGKSVKTRQYAEPSGKCAIAAISFSVLCPSSKRAFMISLPFLSVAAFRILLCIYFWALGESVFVAWISQWAWYSTAVSLGFLESHPCISLHLCVAACCYPLLIWVKWKQPGSKEALLWEHSKSPDGSRTPWVEKLLRVTRAENKAFKNTSLNIAESWLPHSDFELWHWSYDNDCNISISTLQNFVGK